MDLYFSTKGDLALASNGDIAMTENVWRDSAQQAYLRIMTEPGDFILYPNLGTDMSELSGMPQSKETAEHGANLIRAALDREGSFVGKTINIAAVPMGPQAIRFDIYIATETSDVLLMSIEQDLGFRDPITGGGIVFSDGFFEDWFFGG